MPYRSVNSGLLCIAQQNVLDNCSLYNSDGTGCNICDSNTQGLESVGCRLPPFCAAVDRVSKLCTSCLTGRKLDVNNKCIIPLPDKWAADTNCETPYNSTHCAYCKNSRVIAIDDHSNDDLYGVGQCVSLTALNGCVLPDGCELILRTED